MLEKNVGSRYVYENKQISYKMPLEKSDNCARLNANRVTF